MIPFVGREEEIEQVKNIVCERRKAIICIAANTGMGKTELSRVLEKKLAEDKNVITGWHRVQSRMEEYHPFLETLSKLIKNVDEKEKVKNRLKWLQKAVSKDAWRTTKGIAGAGLKDAMGSLLKLLKVNIDISNVSAEVEKILREASKEWSTKSTVDKLLAENKEAVITTYNRLLRSISEFSPESQKFVLILDQVEDSSEVFQEFLKAVAKKLPEKFYLIFTINDENPAGVKFLKEHKADFQYYETCPIELKGLNNAEIRKLIEEMTGVYKSPDEVDKVVQATDGRPLMIIPWIQSKDFDQTKIDEQKLRVYGYFDDNFWALDPQARKLSVTLSILPLPLKKGISDYAGIMGVDNHKCGELIHNLESKNIFKRYDNKPWFSHALMKNFIFENTDDPVKNESAELIIKFLRKEYPKEIEAFELGGLGSTYATLLPYTNEFEETYAQNIDLGNYHYNISSYQVALDHFQRAGEAAEELKENKKIGTALNNIGEIYRAWGKYDQAIEYYERSLKICQETGDRQGEGASLNNIGLVFDAWGKYDQAIEYYERSLKICQETGDRQGEGVSLSNIGLVYEAWGKYDQAIEYYKRSLEITQEIGDRKQEGVSLNNIGEIYRAWGKYDQAIEYHEKSLKIKKEIGDLQGEGVSLNNIGEIYRAWGKYDQAIEYYKRSLKITQEIGDRKQEGVSLNNIGMVYDAWGKYDQAIEYYKRDLKICQEIGDRQGEGVSLNNIGEIYRAWGKYDQAIEYYKKDLKICQKTGDRQGEGVSLNNIASVHHAWGKHDRAIQYFKKGLQIFESVGDPQGEGVSLNNIGMVYDAWGKYDQAIEYYKRSLKITQEIGDRKQEGVSLNNIGEIYRAWGKYDQAIEYYKRSLKITQEIGDRKQEGVSLNNVGLVYTSWGKYDKAIELYKRSLKLAQEIGDQKQEGVSLNNIGMVYDAWGKYDQALEYMIKSLNIFEGIGAAADAKAVRENIEILKSQMKKKKKE